MPGRYELSNINDAFGKRNSLQQAILEKHKARGDNRQFLQTSHKGNAEAAKEVQNLPDDPKESSRVE